MLEIVPLAPEHDRTAFDCGEPSLNDYLRLYSGQHTRQGFSRTFVAVESDTARVIGYYSLAAGSVSVSLLPQHRKLPRHPVPVAVLARLAVDRQRQGQQLGALLLMDALRRVQEVAEELGIHAVVLDALTDTAKQFYLHFGFTPLLDDPLHLFIPLNLIRRLKL